MNSFLASIPINEFATWSSNHLPSSNDDDNPAGGATPIALAEPSSDGAVPTDRPHLPWVIPGVGGAF